MGANGQLERSAGALETATLGGGCFWCLDPIFDQLEGVAEVVVGYAGGEVKDPTYAQICTGRTGHAEVVQVQFDPEVISFREILEIFFTFHDPTTLNRQGNDVGPQYRSAIFYHSEAQRETAETVISAMESADLWGAPFVTQLAPLEVFYRGEDYHQNYFINNPGQGYCQVIIAPKVAKFREKYKEQLKRDSAS